MTDQEDKYRCPVCGEEFEDVGSADRHYDYHKPSEYILESWTGALRSEGEIRDRLEELENEQIDSEQIENDATRRRYMRYQLAIEQLEWVLDE